MIVRAAMTKAQAGQTAQSKLASRLVARLGEKIILSGAVEAGKDLPLYGFGSWWRIRCQRRA